MFSIANLSSLFGNVLGRDIFGTCVVLQELQFIVNAPYLEQRIFKTDNGCNIA